MTPRYNLSLSETLEPITEDLGGKVTGSKQGASKFEPVLIQARQLRSHCVLKINFSFHITDGDAT